MNKGLEYVKNQIVKLKDDLQHYTMVEKDSALASQIRYDLEQFEIIEKELKEYEKLKEDIEKCSCWKEHKALEIIKNKNVSIWVFRRTHNVDEYNERVNSYYSECAELTQEEYDLLKEALNYGE